MIELQIYLYAALFFSMTGYAIYWYGLRKQLVRPNRFSWLIWSAVTTVEALTYQAVNEGLVQNLIFFVSAASCLFITIAIWRDSVASRPTRMEIVAMAISLLAVLLWLGFQSQFWAHLLVVAAVPIGFIPTWISAGEDKRREMTPAWGLWTLADLLTLVLIVRSDVNDAMELPYIIMELVCHGAIWLRIGLSTINPLRALREAPYEVDERNLCGNPASAFSVRWTDKGHSVFAARAFPAGAKLMEFTGPRYQEAEILVHLSGQDDRFLQVGPDTYLGPSGQMDDLVNHSCEPNCGLRFEGDHIFLVAIRPIQSGEEISWDYSTTSSSSCFSMRCACGTDSCRDVIGDFEFLDPEIQKFYQDLALVPPYLQHRANGSHLPLLAA